MRFPRTDAIGLLVVGALVLSGCGSNTNTSAPSSGPSAKVDCGGKAELNASGATAQANAIQQFVNAYAHACPGYTLDYEANGSGAGVEQFIKGETDLAGSGIPLDPAKGETNKAAARCGSPAWQLPALFQPIAVTYHVNGLSSLKLDAPTLAKVFNGTVTRWDDPAIRALNAGTSLPSSPIRVIFRSDESGNSANFQQYLSAASNGAWGRGDGATFETGVGTGADGDNGVTAALETTDGSITYTAWSVALGKQLNIAQIITSASSDPVSITPESVAKTIAGARIVGQGNDLVLDTSSFAKPTQPGAYPIVEPTYEIVCSKYPESATGRAVRAFMQAIIGPGQEGLAQYGSITPPSGLQARLATAVNAIS
ncbi:phosphate ABC transporter substrate-binding protein PstS [Mycobacterium asiaticum]|uniref:phosphate ABC transporter substrate-binding protein PstS n=1 Tax=Mycobacterium asiaticum TaxID=1790 RepID=UPI0007EF28EA|nr:phosphate ABC transporter substrate-binding protein PstS [Mycobacterium asiaticum]OBI98716.1 phosphate ABC transporter substrate-binding protein PstS [Mycobacterium asiaticum]